MPLFRMLHSIHAVSGASSPAGQGWYFLCSAGTLSHLCGVGSSLPRDLELWHPICIVGCPCIFELQELIFVLHCGSLSRPRIPVRPDLVDMKPRRAYTLLVLLYAEYPNHVDR